MFNWTTVLVLLTVPLSVASIGALFKKEYDASEVIGKTPEQLLQLRGFGSETHYARTQDGYYIHVVRVINPLMRSRPLRRPVVFNHGLLESSTFWLINARDVRPLDSQCADLNEETPSKNHTLFINGPMMLANHGYDVWLMSMRGTDWSQRHDSLSPKDKSFWNFSLDELTLGDVPTVIDYVLAKTNSSKVGYVGHSQATFNTFGLLALRPNYTDVIEPVVALAPVAYMEHITSVARILYLATLVGTGADFHGPFPKEAPTMRRLLGAVCGTKIRPVANGSCKLVNLLISGKGRGFLKGYWSHLPFYASLKLLRHFGQLVKYKRFMMYDYGAQKNLKLYGNTSSPNYPIGEIKSKSLCLFSTKSDALSRPQDVTRFVKQLKVPLFKNVFINQNFNHFDLILDKQAGELVFYPMLKIMEHFEGKSKSNCSQNSRPQQLPANQAQGQSRSEELPSVSDEQNSTSSSLPDEVTPAGNEQNCTSPPSDEVSSGDGLDGGTSPLPEKPLSGTNEQNCSDSTPEEVTSESSEQISTSLSPLEVTPVNNEQNSTSLSPDEVTSGSNEQNSTSPSPVEENHDAGTSE